MKSLERSGFVTRTGVWKYKMEKLTYWGEGAALGFGFYAGK
jgi:hypothetical protein